MDLGWEMENVNQYIYTGSSFLYAVMGCVNGVCFVFPIGSSPVE